MLGHETTEKRATAIVVCGIVWFACNRFSFDAALYPTLGLYILILFIE